MSVYKKSLHAFFLHVHPDFFARSQHSNPEWQRCNEQSIARLNELLDWARAFKAGEQRNPPAAQISFRFYRRADDDAVSSSAVLQESGTALPSQLTAQFDLPKGFTPNAPSASAQVERSVNRFLRDLLRKAGCLDTVANAASSAQEDRLAQEELKSTNQRGGHPVSRGDRDLFDKRQKIANQLHKKPKVETLLDAASETVSDATRRSGPYSNAQHFYNTTPTLEDLVEEDQLLFSRHLSPLQCAAATQRLQEFLPQMIYEEWSHVPILFTHLANCYQVGKDVAGTITIPWDFELQRFLAFLRRDGVKIRSARESLEETARRIEANIADLCRRGDLDDVLITCTHREALPVLEMLLDGGNIEELHMLGLSDLTIEISDHFAYRENGVVVLSKDAANDFAQVRERIARLQPRLPELKLRNATAKKMLAEIQECKERFLEDTRAAGADCETASGPYAERLQWAKELARIAPQLAQFDWSDITFALGPLSLDWESGVISLPANFDGASFVKYVDDMRRERKEQQEEENARFEALRRQEEIERLTAASSDVTQRVALNPGIRDSSGNDDDEGSQNSSLLLGAAERKSSKQQHPAGNWRNEYLVASQTSAERGGMRYRNPHHREDEHTELFTERPMYHDPANIVNEQDATEQLEWEGFYQSPYGPPRVPDRNLEEIDNAFMYSNRNHRQAAVKKMVQQLDEQYGLSQNRFRKMTLGDRTGINDPRIKAAEYPTVAKGAYAGDAPRKQPLS